MITKQKISTVLTILLVTFSLNAQDSTTVLDQSVSPVVLFKKAQVFFSQNKRAEAQKILESLLQKFPNDFEIRGFYLETRLTNVGGDEFYGEKALEALEFYKKVPLAERTEKFYASYYQTLLNLKKLDELPALQNEIIRRFPRGGMALRLRVQEASDENDVVKAAELYEALIKDFEKIAKLEVLYEKYFSIISKDLSKFDAPKIISTAKKYEELQFTAFVKESKSKPLKEAQQDYLQAVLDISDNLREKFPAESLLSAQKGLTFFDKTEADEDVKDFKILLRQAAFRSYLKLKDWKNAQKAGLEITKWSEYSIPVENIDEAKFQRDYAFVLENLKQIPLAREHFFVASIMNQEFRKDLREFNLKYRLSPIAETNFEKLTKAKFGKFLDSRESLLKANLLKTRQNTAAANFRLTDLNGKKISLADYRGKVLILAFWTTWCEPCVGELERLKTAYKNYGDNPKIAFAIVSLDDRKEKVPVIVKERGYEFPVFYAGENTENDYKVNGIPKLFIIDAQGNIRFQKDGFTNNGFYLKELDWMIEAATK